MIKQPIPLHKARDGHDFRILRDRIRISSDRIPRGITDEINDNQTVVFVSISFGETRVNVINDEGLSLEGWTIAFGWSYLYEIEINHEDSFLRLNTLEMVSKALRGLLRHFGTPVDTSDFLKCSRVYFRGVLDYILNETIGDGHQHERIILAMPYSLHAVLTDSMKLRPHIDSEIQDNC